MEPPAVNVSFQTRSNNGLDKNRRDNLMLRIDPQLSSYASTSHAFEELPENFLESISPQQSTSRSLEIITNHSQNDLETCLSPGLSDQRFTNESVDLLPHLSETALNGVVDDLVEPRREIYIKEESPEVYHDPNVYLPPTYEEEELCNLHRHSPISMQNDISSSSSNVDGHFLPSRQVDSLIIDKRHDEKTPSPIDSKEGLLPAKLEGFDETPPINYSTLLDLNMELEDNVSIDTKSLCKQIANELKHHSIPQAIFAEKILCRSQGTLSDLLRNPKPWPKLKSGRETFRRMYNWMRQPLNIRLAILDIKESNSDFLVNSSPPTPAKSSRIRQQSVSDESVHSYKRPRLVFSDVQKSTLQAIFKETQRPSREMQATIADHLGLDLSTVSNYFMNARRRSRNGGILMGDEMGGFDKTPPETPPKSGYRRHNPSTSSTSTSSTSFDPQHINEAVDAVISNFATKIEDEFQEGPSNYGRNRTSQNFEFMIKSECESPIQNEHV